MITESQNAVAEMKSLSAADLEREYASFNEYVQKSMILYNVFAWREDRVSELLAAELPELLNAYEQWRAVNQEWMASGSRLGLHLGSVIEIGLKGGDEIFDFWKNLATAFEKKRKVGNE